MPISTVDMLKGFGCRQAYESLSCRNPRGTVDGYGDFDLRAMSAMVLLPLGSVGMDGERPLRCASARFSQSRTRLEAVGDDIDDGRARVRCRRLGTCG